ncbi:MAG: DNA gyrase inhibitor YacG [Alphaproteobacteria bacterium]|nr:DNA gyrase inhibitor YacG [Alphaproteobacteria bacterium]
MSEPRGTCPICHKRAADAYAPFCSKRCADIDLHRWLSEGYALPASEDDDSVPDGTEPDSG